MSRSEYEGLKNTPEQNSKYNYWQFLRTIISVATYIAPTLFLDENRKKFDGTNEKDVIATFLFCSSMLINSYEVISSSLESCKSRNNNIKSDTNLPAEDSDDIESDNKNLLQNSSSYFEPIQILEYCRSVLGYCILPAATIGQSAAVASQILNPSPEIIEMTNLAIQVFSIVGLPSSSLFTAIDLKIQEHIKNNSNDETQQQENQRDLINFSNAIVFLNVAAAIASVALIMTINKENEMVNSSIITAFTTLAKLGACYSKNQMLPKEAQIVESCYAFTMATIAGIASSMPFFSNSSINSIADISAADMGVSGLRAAIDNYTAKKVAEQKLDNNETDPSPTLYSIIKEYFDHFLFVEAETDPELNEEKQEVVEEKPSNNEANPAPNFYSIFVKCLENFLFRETEPELKSSNSITTPANTASRRTDDDKIYSVSASKDVDGTNKGNISNNYVGNTI